ncbi:MAG: phosphoadenosine phosphosulfate reductase family protein [Gammaproteobacteria bacterium]|nr:phosphoadenosine phosphosulfate reductase family protein [Gammaproteobacteria bacterium]
MKIESWQLKQRQSLPLEIKVKMSKTRVREWYEFYNGNVYIAFSGGKDSTVLLDIARKLYPNIPAVFLDTGLEYPEIRKFVKTIDNVIWLKPKMRFDEVITKYGYPIVSKKVANSISRFRLNPEEVWRYNKFINGTNADGTATQFSIPKKWQNLALYASFKISDHCCTVMKKNPVKRYEKETGRLPILGMMASDSTQREIDYLKTGCNSFMSKRPMSNPIGFWLEQDILKYIKIYSIPYSSVYGEICEDGNVFRTTGEHRTGCMFCMFGVHLEKEPNRFQRMKQTHPKLYRYCMDDLGLKVPLEFIGVSYD